MMSIDRDRWRVVEPLLDHALDLSAEQRAQWLDGLRTSDPVLAAEVELLLAGDAAADRTGFLDRPADVTLAGLQLGGYTLERPLGQGGSGSVWLARRSDGRFEGLAAVKLLNLALLGAAGQERFRREGSLLARLDHPGIARLLDAGVSPSGQPFLVLEHVDGERIDDYARAHALDREERVRLFLQVLDAVGCAHASLIVHRDLKPSNILVTAAGTVKLLDFGIAKLLDSAGERRSGPFGVVTETTSGLTPHYAAPEQADGHPVTTATDVYAAGVLLYVLLSGRHPTAEGRVTQVEVLRALHEVHPPPLGMGDLDTVVAKALRKEPSERYATVAAFADDLRHWLRHEPVTARPVAWSYRLRKLVRRKPLAAALTSLAALLLDAWIATVLVDRAQVRRALAEATTSARKAEQVSDFAVGLFDPGERGASAYADSLSARALLARGVERAHELSGQPAIEAEMLDLIGRVRYRLGDYAGARKVLDEALAIRKRTLGDDHPDVATTLIHLGDVVAATEQGTHALDLYRQALALRRRAYGDDDPRTTDALYLVATNVHMAGDYAAGRMLFAQWMAAVAKQPPQLSEARADQYRSVSRLAEFSRQLPAAEQAMRRALALDSALYGVDHHTTAIDLATLGGLLDDERRDAESDTVLRAAIASLRRSDPAGHPDLAHALRDYGYHLVTVHRFAEADRVWSEARDLYERYDGRNSLAYVNAEAFVGLSQSGEHRYADAERTLRDALRLGTALRPPPAPIILRTRGFLGETLRAEGRLGEAEPLLVEVASQRATIGPLPAIRRFAASSLVKLYESQGRTAEAAKYRCLALPPTSPACADSTAKAR